MQWTNEGDYWCMPLEFHERYFRWIGSLGEPIGRESWIVMVNAQLRFASGDPMRDVRNAWRALRVLHPGIAVELFGEEKRYYPIRDTEALDAWCDATFRLETDALSADDLFKRHVRTAEPQATCHWIPATNQVALMASHWRWDARGASWILNDLLRNLGDPPSLPLTFRGEEVKNLPVSFGEALGIPEAQNPGWDQRGRELHAMGTEGGPGIALRPSYPDVLPGDTVCEKITLSTEETLALRTGARCHGLTIAPVLNASAIVETALINPTSTATRFLGFGLFDLRKYCAPPSDGPQDASALRISFLPINVDAHAPWKDLASTLSAFYHQSWDPKHGDRMFTRVPYLQTNQATLQDTPPDAVQLSEPMINSLGIIDEYIQHHYGSVEVEDVGHSNLSVGKQITIQVFTWRGKMHLSANFNEAFYSSTFVRTFLLALKNNALKNLGIGGYDKRTN
ncbi:hypothetical protein N7528_006889 [Penicillium herquei]|nr:hypothetical protein N7528_006889 [Penicillium herquei]